MEIPNYDVEEDENNIFFIFLNLLHFNEERNVSFHEDFKLYCEIIKWKYQTMM